MPRLADLLPAMAPYDLAWPEQDGLPRARNMYAGVSAEVQTQGERRDASWYGAELGYFPDGDPQVAAGRRVI